MKADRSGSLRSGIGEDRSEPLRPHARLLRWRQWCSQYRRKCSRSMVGSITWGSVMCRAVSFFVGPVGHNRPTCHSQGYQGGPGPAGLVG